MMRSTAKESAERKGRSRFRKGGTGVRKDSRRRLIRSRREGFEREKPVAKTSR